MKYVWYVQDYTSMEVNEVFTTKKAAFIEAKKYGTGRFKTLTARESYWYFTADDKTDPACYINKIPVQKAKRI